jgi:hypothetical protein
VTADEVDLRRYRSKKFSSYALSNCQSRLTWDQTDPERERFIAEAFKAEGDLDEFGYFNLFVLIDIGF